MHVYLTSKAELVLSIISCCINQQEIVSVERPLVASMPNHLTKHDYSTESSGCAPNFCIVKFGLKLDVRLYC
jgi:hypothetical protein